MVRGLALLFACLSTLAMAGESRLVTECNKALVYQGELFSCQFTLYSPEDRIEVEVSKFPEFRGYWSENTALRQGPLLLLPELRFPGLRKALVGTYQLTAMRGNDLPVISPMRIVLRTFGMTGPKEEELTSEAPTLALAPLPPLPAPMKPTFHGAVGNFILKAENTLARFVPNEPLVLRYFLTGTGNFPEINSLNPQFPPQIKILSERSATVGSGAVQAKAFELTLLLEDSQAADINPLVLTFFDPDQKRYLQTQSEAIHLSPLPRPRAESVLQDVTFPTLVPDWRPAIPLGQNRAFWILQALLGSLWLALATSRGFRWWKRKRESHPHFILKQRWKALLAEPPALERDAWLVAAETLVHDTVSARSRRPLVTRRQSLEYASRHWGKAARDSMEALISHRESLYSLSPKPPPPIEEVRPKLKRLKGVLLRRPKAP